MENLMVENNHNNAGNRTVARLFRDALGEPEYSHGVPGGFVWWAYDRPQFVRVVGEREGPDGPSDMAYLVEVRTPVLINAEVTPKHRVLMGLQLMDFATMAGPVINEQERTVDLVSVVAVHDEVERQMEIALSMAAMLQVDFAWRMGSLLAKQKVGEDATVPHMTKGLPKEPHPAIHFVENEVLEAGRQPSRWSSEEFQSVFADDMQRPPALFSRVGPHSVAADFPFGDESSLFQARSDQSHMRYGNGLLILQTFPLPPVSIEEGYEIAWLMNKRFLEDDLHGYGLGSFCYREPSLHFCTFIPNMLYTSGLLRNFYVASANRAQAVSLISTGKGWENETFDIAKSALARELADEKSRLKSN
jgi:hypothetical protein